MLEFIRMIAEIQPYGGEGEARNPDYPAAALNELIRKAKLLLPYQCNSSDVGISGMERLRNRDEFMITIPVWRGITADEIRAEMKASIQTYMQPDWFNFDAANAGIDEFVDLLDMGAFDGLDEVTDDEAEPVNLFTYWQAPEEVPVY